MEQYHIRLWDGQAEALRKLSGLAAKEFNLSEAVRIAVKEKVERSREISSKRK